MSNQDLSINTTLSSLRFSIYEGVFANIFANLTGSVFLPAFALVLGANSLQIGILASAPFFANLSQLLGAYLVEKLNKRKTIAIRAAFIARMLWIPIIIMAFGHSEDPFNSILHSVIILVIGYHLIAAISSVSWLSWMSSIVPLEIRGRFFGLRNAILGAANIIFTLLGGRFLDWFAHNHPNSPQLYAFEILFSLAVVCGFLSLIFLSRQHEPTNKRKSQVDFKGLYHSPFRQTNFKKLIRFAVAWSLVVNMASPFFLVYMLQVLKFNYVTVATLVVSSAFADLVGMWVWGHVCDKLGHRPIMIIAAIIASLLPIVWFFTGKNFGSIYILIPLLHFSGGFFWAGYNLCSVNLVFRIAPRERNAAFFAFWSAVNGVAAGCGALLGGLLVKFSQELATSFSLSQGFQFKIVFLISGLLRLCSLLFLVKVPEPESLPFTKTIRVLRNIKSWATMMGFHPALQFFLPKSESIKNSSPYWPIWRTRKNGAEAEDSKQFQSESV